MELVTAQEHHLAEILGWFATENEARNWGGPAVRFPLLLNQVKDDIQWSTAKSYAFIDNRDTLVGFIQVLNKYDNNHLGRVVVSPWKRGKKLGCSLMEAFFDGPGVAKNRFSLFVYKDNIPARKLYMSLGFQVRPYPEGVSRIRDCIFMVKELPHHQQS